MKSQDEAAKQEAEAVVSLIEAEVSAVMAAAEQAKELVDKAAHDASEVSIIEGNPPQTGVKHFWAALLREITAADPNTPTPSP